MIRKLLACALLMLGVIGARAQENIKVGNTTRQMIVYAPKNLPQNRPLVITLHGFNQSAEYQRNNTQWNNLADTAKIVVVYPQYQGGFWDTGGVRGSSNDIQFIETIIDEMHNRYGINKNRVYVSGFSLGAMMTYNVMEQLSDKIAACAPVSGVRFDNRAPKVNGRQVPFIHTHGTGDNVFKWGGDPGHQAGGYPAISEYVQKWATYYKCTDKKFIQPYPANKSGSKDAMTRWKKPDSDFEVVLLQLDGVGHWHSDAQQWGGISTTQEIWRFMQRFSLGPEPPKVLSVQPENNSFDLLPEEHRTVTLTLDGKADASKATAKMTFGSKTVNLTCETSEDSEILTFKVPDTTTLPQGECTLTVSGIRAPGGGVGASFSADYIYGVTEVMDVYVADTLLVPNWPSMQEELGQCIPWGWKLVHTDSKGSATTVKSGTAGLDSGCRLMYFPDGGEFSAGFYLSARDYAKARLSFGEYASYRMRLPKGYHELTFRSTYWNTSSRDASATFDVAVRNLSSSNPVYYLSANGIKSKGSQLQSTTKKPKSTAQHSYVFNVPSSSNYIVDFTMSQGWNAVLVADVMVTTYPSIPERYKGTLHRLLLQAAAICADNDNPALDKLREAWEQYRDFSSTSPSEYEAAISAMRSAFDTLPVGVTAQSATQDALSVRYYSIDGRRLSAPQQGITIERRGNAARKIVRM